MSGFDPRWIRGKTVANVEMRAFDDGRGGRAHAPVVFFTDGSMIWFTTEETDVGSYGTSISYRPKRRRSSCG